MPAGVLCPKMFYKYYQFKNEFRLYLFPCLLKKIPSKKEIRCALDCLWNELEGVEFTCQVFFTASKDHSYRSKKLEAKSAKAINDLIIDSMYKTIQRLDKSAVYCRAVIGHVEGQLIEDLDPIETLYRAIGEKPANIPSSLARGFHKFRKQFVPKVRPDTIKLQRLPV